METMSCFSFVTKDTVGGGDPVFHIPGLGPLALVTLYFLARTSLLGGCFGAAYQTPQLRCPIEKQTRGTLKTTNDEGVVTRASKPHPLKNQAPIVTSLP